MMTLYRVFNVCILFGIHVTLFAQNNLDSCKLLKEVIIVASRYNEIIPAQQLSGEKLEALSALSIADAVRYFSGVQIKDYGGIGGVKTIDVRSMGSNHMGVFYDGIQLGNAQNGQIDLGKFSLDNIEKITLYNGQKSEIFQSAKDFGSAGTIYLTTRRPYFSDGKKTNLMLTFRTGSFGLANPSVLWEQKIVKNITSSFNAEYIYSTGKYKFRYHKILPDGSVAWDTTAVRQNGDINSWRLEGGVHGYMEHATWNLKAYLYNSEKGIPGAIINNVWKRSQRQWDRNFFMQGSFQKHFLSRYDFLINVKYANDRMRYFNPDTTLMYIDNTFLQQELYVSTANKYVILPFWDVNLSFDYQFNNLNSNMKEFVFPIRNTVLAAFATAINWQRLKAQASLLGTFIKENTKLGKTIPNRHQYTPAFFLSFQPFKNEHSCSHLLLQAFYKHIFRMPTFNDLYYTDIGNVALKPEYVAQYNVGLQYNKHIKAKIVNGLNVHTDFYYNDVKDKIIAVPKGNGQYRWLMMNIGRVKILGVDALGQIEFNLPAEIKISTGLNYTFQQARDFSDPKDNDPIAGSYGGQIAYIPRHNGSAIVNVIWKLWEMNYSFIYVGERYHNSSNIRENHEQPWYTHDLTLAKTFKLSRKNKNGFSDRKMKISTDINNIFNQYYDVVLNYPMPGRNYKITFKMEL